MNNLIKCVLATALIVVVSNISKGSINAQCQIAFSYIEKNISFEYCIHKNSQINSWDQCKPLCCTAQASIDKSTTVSNVGDCLGPFNHQTYQFKYILLSVIIFILLFILLVYLIGKGLAYYNAVVTNNKTEADQFNNKITRSILNINWIEDSNPCFQISSQEINESKIHMRKNHICCLCTQIGVNIYSYCGHSFHTDCFYNWMSMKRKCPKCLKFKIKRIKIYCKQCYAYFFVLNLQEYLKVGPLSVDCLGCSAKQQVQNKIVKHYWIDEECSGSCQQDTK